MNVQASHGVGAASGVTIGAILAGILSRYSVVTLSPAEYALAGSAFLLGGAGIAHALWNIGVVPIFARLIRGPKQTGTEQPAPVQPAPSVAAAPAPAPPATPAAP